MNLVTNNWRNLNQQSPISLSLIVHIGCVATRLWEWTNLFAKKGWILKKVFDVCKNQRIDYLRTTHECTFGNLNPVLVAAIRAYIEKYELGDSDSSALICCEIFLTK